MLSDELAEKVDALGAKLDRSRSWLVQDAVREYLAKQEGNDDDEEKSDS